MTVDTVLYLIALLLQVTAFAYALRMARVGPAGPWLAMAAAFFGMAAFRLVGVLVEVPGWEISAAAFKRLSAAASVAISALLLISLLATRQISHHGHLATAARRESEARLEVGLRAGNSGTWEWDIPGDRVTWSDPIYAFHGLAPGTFGGRVADFTPLVHPDDRPRVAAAIEAALASDAPYQQEYRALLPGGGTRWILTTGLVYRDAAGRPVRMIGAASDIDERKRAEEAVRLAEERLRLALDAADTGTWDWDMAADTVTWSDRIAALHGLGPGEFGGRSADFAALVHPDDRDRVWAAIRTSIADRAPYQVEFRATWPDGTVRWLGTTGRAYYAPDGTPVRMLGATTDVTARHLAAERQAHVLEAERAARAEAERVSRMKDEFLATLSHELRTPLNAILGWAQLLRADGTSPDDLAQGLETIERNARAQTRIIEDLLDMSRIVSGRIRLDVGPLDPADPVRAALDTVGPAAAARGVHLVADLDPAAGPVLGDPGRLQQVFWNLLSNAVKFTPRGGRAHVTVARDGSHALVTVADTGQGIPPEFLPHAFDRFRQADSSTTRQHGGLGLGLGIVKQLVELHGGSVAAHSDGPGRGATFAVRLPVVAATVPPDRGAAPAPDLDPAVTPPGGSAGRGLAGVRVLVVDDDPDALALVRRLLTDAGAAVDTAPSVPAALGAVARARPDVLLSDVGMPGQDGHALIRQLRALPPDRGGGVPAVALSAYARPDDRARSLLAGFQLHLTKPVDPAELVAAVARAADPARPAPPDA